MRTTFSTVAVLASSLLAREVFAAPHLHRHKRDVVTDVVMVTDEVEVTEDGDGVYETGAAVAIATTTIDGTPITVSSTPAATPSTTEAAAAAVTPASTSSVSSSSTPGAVFVQEAAASTKASSTTSTPVETPTTLATVASSTSSTAAATTSSTSSSSKKRGLAYNDADLLSGFVSSDSQVDWCYNWDSSTASTPSGIEYVPLLWGTEDEFTSVWTANADAALAAGSTHLMAFNEPDYSGQADLTVAAAVTGYITYMQPYAAKASIGTPAVTNGAAPMGTTYLSNFVSALKTAGGSYDFCAVHWYDSATNIDYFKDFMQDASTACDGKPVWLTEFGASGTADEQNTFLQTVMPWMDEQSYIERYAYFMVEADSLISTGTTLSTLGNTFATFT